MRATTTLLENNKIMLTVEIDDAEMDEAMDAAAKTLSKQVSVKGFRKGKVPKNVLIANIGGTVGTAIGGDSRVAARLLRARRRRFPDRPDRSARHQHHRRRRGRATDLRGRGRSPPGDLHQGPARVARHDSLADRHRRRGRRTDQPLPRDRRRAQSRRPARSSPATWSRWTCTSNRSPPTPSRST